MKNLSSSKGGIYTQNEILQAYFKEIVDELNAEHGLEIQNKAQPGQYIIIPSRFPSVSYVMIFRSNNRVCVELYFSSDKAEMNDHYLNELYREKDAIEAEIGEALDWEWNDDRPRTRVAVRKPGSIEDESLEVHKEWMIRQFKLFHEVFDPRLERITQEISVNLAFILKAVHEEEKKQTEHLKNISKAAQLVSIFVALSFIAGGCALIDSLLYY